MTITTTGTIIEISTRLIIPTRPPLAGDGVEEEPPDEFGVGAPVAVPVPVPSVVPLVVLLDVVGDGVEEEPPDEFEVGPVEHKFSEALQCKPDATVQSALPH